MNIYSHEISSYKLEVKKLTQEYESGSNGENRTHFSLALSNRSNLIIIGLCSLIEAYLYEVAEKEEENSSFKIDDIKGNGLSRLRLYLSRSNKIDFGTMKNWGSFSQVYILRNALVHGYGGLVDSVDIDRVRKALKVLKLEECLIADRRIRLSPPHLLSICLIVEDIVDKLNECT
ncbi:MULTISPECIES: hypothetical protein [Colwellia]|uniref:RiboL-PSP-HEPN domain-containing protein n=1 Tax=Colwellia marinimaniae TaxID=1513592 RepID=A0ABQ0MY41_9GAMM|nr:MULTISPECIES: hypothetical protein [Colwellia]GAW97292.1 hypothetical protein MTCD1_02918 [Colwellia marinimaniae]